MRWWYVRIRGTLRWIRSAYMLPSTSGMSQQLDEPSAYRTPGLAHGDFGEALVKNRIGLTCVAASPGSDNDDNPCLKAAVGPLDLLL
jgi:hypothetical protein